MSKRLSALWILAVLLIVVVVACKKETTEPGTDSGYDRGAMLASYADNYIMPAYTDMSGKINALQTKLTAFANNPAATTLADVRAAFNTAYNVWQKTDLLEFGPAEDISLRMYINTYPVTVSKLNNNIANGGYDLEQFVNKDAQGFPAIDYLLNGLAENDNDIIALYTTDAQATARKQYLLDVAAKMSLKINNVLDKWATYKTTFIAATGTDVNSSTSKMVNAFVLYYERYLRSGKVGLPVGAMTGVAKPELSEAYYSKGLDKENLQAALQSVENFYLGKSYDGTKEGQGMYHYLKAVGTKDDAGTLMADLIVTELNNASGDVQSLSPGGIKADVQANRPAVLALYDRLQAVVPLLKVDMVSAFGISITYVDNDGD